MSRTDRHQTDALIGNISPTLLLERRRAAHHVAHVERSGLIFIAAVVVMVAVMLWMLT